MAIAKLKEIQALLSDLSMMVESAIEDYDGEESSEVEPSEKAPAKEEDGAARALALLEE